jgi:hypothetical protein
LSRERIRYSGELESLVREGEGLSCGDLEEICRRAILSAAKLLLEKEAAAPDGVELTENDLLRSIDQWKLMRSL